MIDIKVILNNTHLLIYWSNTIHTRKTQIPISEMSSDLGLTSVTNVRTYNVTSSQLFRVHKYFNP